VSRLQQGAVVWANLPPLAGRRPVVILTRDSAIRHLTALTVAPVTRTIRQLQTEVILEPADGVPTICAVTLDNIFTIKKKHILPNGKISSPRILAKPPITPQRITELAWGLR
jgi:mRNA interferase MazF